MKKIMVLSGSRAEYYLLLPILREIEKSTSLECQFVVTGTHLSSSYGYTVADIKKDKVRIDYYIDMCIDSLDKSAIPKSMGLFMIQFADCLKALEPDILLVLGDRYEILAACSCAVVMNIPIAHIHGGEITEGAIDEQIRHAITKMAHLHFAATEHYKENILQMGEEVFRVYNTGAPVVERIINSNFETKSQLEKELDIHFNGNVFLITYHPATVENLSELNATKLLDALDRFEGTFIFTGSNSDYGGNRINKILKNHVSTRKDCYYFDSLGLHYLSMMKNADVIIGNSSSGIIEAPCLRIPVVNIGKRQKGRLRHPNIIDVGDDTNLIVSAIQKALSNESFKHSVRNMKVLYGDGTTSKQIVTLLENIKLDKAFIYKKLDYEKRI